MDPRDPAVILTLLALACFALLLASNHIGAAAYALTQRWRETLFIAACALAGLLAAPHLPALNRDMADFSRVLPSISPASGEDSIAGDIAICKKFVAASARGAAYAPEGLSHGFFSFGPHDPWESCARVFGMNYWKYDISIGGRNGGRVLCETYGKRGAAPSEKVESWCRTVFAAKPKA
jgi:hypothetical protein